MTISESVFIAPLSAKGSEITAASFGVNIVLGYERFGTKPWEKYDEIQSAVGFQAIRYPGGSQTELLFDYANPQATSAVTSSSNILQLTTPDAFLQYCASANTRATIDLPVLQLLTGAKYGYRDFDTSKAGEVRAYVDHLLETAGPQGIATFELGNEYESYMTSVEYGKVASAVGLMVHQEIESYYAAHPGDDAYKPTVAVQVWGQSAGGTYSLTDLSNRNHTVMAQFSQEEMGAITAVTSHFYYNEGINPGEPNYHTYSNIQASVGYSLDMMNAWSNLTGRSLETIFSEWNVNYRDTSDVGLMQIPVLLELFTSFVEGGVGQLDFWSAMYNSTSLGNYRGELQAAGTLFQVMTHDLIGMQATEIPVNSSNYDIHAFSGKGHAVVFVSSMIDQAMTLKMDISTYLDRYDLTSAKLMQADVSKADGAFKDAKGLAPWQEADVPTLLTSQNILSLFKSGQLTDLLGPHETLVLEFTLAHTVLGTMAQDKLAGLMGSDRINGLGAADVINGMGGDDSLFGSMGNDTISGGYGQDRIWGGLGNDILFGGFGNDTIEGLANNDQIHGGPGSDYLAGGSGSDTLWGDLGADAFVFRKGDLGTDVVADFTPSQGDFLIYDGSAPVSASDFHLEVRAVHELGVEAISDLLVHYGTSGQILWELQDAGHITSLTLQDATTGAVFALI